MLDFIKKHFEREFTKRQREREKSQKKENFLRRDFFRKNSLFQEKSLFSHIFLKISWRRVIKHENGSIGCVRAIRIVKKSRKSIRSGQKVKKRIFSGKKSLLKNSLFS